MEQITYRGIANADGADKTSNNTEEAQTANADRVSHRRDKQIDNSSRYNRCKQSKRGIEDIEVDKTQIQSELQAVITIVTVKPDI